MQKIYVLDTNVLLCDPASILSFADRDVVIPMTVIEELDKKERSRRTGLSCKESIPRPVGYP